MADYAGAVAAIRQRMIDNWSTTQIAFPNEVPPWGADASGPKDDNDRYVPFVYFEVIGNDGSLRGAGKPGSQPWLYEGHILAHVFVPVGTGDTIAQQHAVAIGEIFRAKGFYNDGQGSIVRTWAPRTDGGGSKADDGNWYRVTMTCPFEFYYQC